MIQAANVGLGIVGKEGMQPFLAADVSPNSVAFEGFLFGTEGTAISTLQSYLSSTFIVE